LTINIEKESNTYSTRGSISIEGLNFAPLSKTTSGLVNLTVLGTGITKEVIQVGDYNKSDNTIGAIFIEEAAIKAYKSAPAGEVNITVKGNGFKDKVLHVADKIIQFIRQ